MRPDEEYRGFSFRGSTVWETRRLITAILRSRRFRLRRRACGVRFRRGATCPREGFAGRGVGADRAFPTVPEEPYAVHRKRFDASVGEDHIGGASQRKLHLLHEVRREREAIREPGIDYGLHGSPLPGGADQSQRYDGLAAIRGHATEDHGFVGPSCPPPMRCAARRPTRMRKNTPSGFFASAWSKTPSSSSPTA